MYGIEFQVNLPSDQLEQLNDWGLLQLRLSTAIKTVLGMHDVNGDTALTVVMSTDENVREMNRTYRGVDATTDILSFPADLPPDLPDEIAEELGIDADGDLNPPYLGDLVIAYSYTARQAQQSGHALHDEMRLLVIHGTLHLLGYDHDTAEREAEMWATQNEALRQLDILIRVPRFFPDVSSDSITDYPNGN